MIIIGLTGSIGMGKSETAKMFAAEGVPVFDADAAVHSLQAKDGAAIAPIEAVFPSVITDGVLDRAKLGTIIFSDAEAKATLEAIIHPMVGDLRIGFFQKAEADSTPFVVLDIPLLFETHGDKACHKVVVVSAREDVQRERVLERPGMTVEKFEQILGKQVPDAEKRAKADYIVETDKGLDYARQQVATIVKTLRDASQDA
ncbi:MAG: dephospho-CoA kinase [Kordiimonadaceae bacterium]|nr:dephospho-CoA kinase [Kordiimonadaceae bacterium]